MKYKVGDKVRVRRDLEEGKAYGGWDALEDMVKMRGETVTIRRVRSSAYELEEKGLMWTDEMLEGLVEDELTAEEAIRIQAEMCSSTECKDCEIDKLRYDSHCECVEFCSKNPKKVIEILKQYKKDHEKKEIEVVQKLYCLVIDEKRTVVHEEEIDSSDSCEEVLKRYCEEHDGKFFAIAECRYEVKE